MARKIKKTEILNAEDANTMLKKEIFLPKRMFNKVVDIVTPTGGTFSDFGRVAIQEKLEREYKKAAK